MKLAFISDVHFGSTDQAAWRLAMRLIRKMNIDTMFLGGDLVDFHPVSSYPKDPATMMGLQSELDTAFEELSNLRQMFPSARFFFKAGNHEDRLQRYLFSRAAELSGLRNLTLPSLLRLDELGCEFIAQDQPYKIGELFLVHGHEVRCGSVYPARGLYQKLNVNLLAGHFHRFGQYMDRSLDGKTRGAWINGTLQRLDPGYTFLNNWSQGFTTVDFTKTGRFKVEQYAFFREKGRVCYVLNGKLMYEKCRPGEDPEPVRQFNLEQVG